MKSIIVLICLLLTSSLHAGLKLTINQGNDKPTPIAVSPFGWSGNKPLPENVAFIIETNLAFSGVFQLMNRANMLSMPTKQDDVYPRDWRLLGQDYLIVGNITPLDDQEEQVSIRFALMDVILEKTVLQDEVVTERASLRNAAHRISDQIFAQLTNYPGAFATKIAYVARQTLGRDRYKYGLYIADFDGRNATLMTESSEPILSPAWSPDAQELAYVSFASGRAAIYRQNIATGKQQRVTFFRGLNGAPAWSPDGQSLAMVLSKDGNPEIYIMTLATGKLTRVAAHYAIDTEPQWMPDGKSLIFTSNRSGTPQIHQVIIKTGLVKRLTEVGNYNARARVVADGSALVLVHRNKGGFQIAYYDIPTKRMIVLTDTRLDESPTVSANGSVVMYASKQRGRSVLSAVSVDGGVKFKIPSKGGDAQEPAFSSYIGYDE